MARRGRCPSGHRGPDRLCGSFPPVRCSTQQNGPFPAAGPRSPVLAITGRIPAPCRAYSGDIERVLEDALGARARQDKELRSQLLLPFRAEFPMLDAFSGFYFSRST